MENPGPRITGESCKSWAMFAKSGVNLVPFIRANTLRNHKLYYKMKFELDLATNHGGASSLKSGIASLFSPFLRGCSPLMCKLFFKRLENIIFGFYFVYGVWIQNLSKKIKISIIFCSLVLYMSSFENTVQ